VGVQAEGGIGWNVAHVIAHVTASSEEAALSSILARGVDYPFELRLRAKADWTTLTTTAACIRRLAENLRMRHGYLRAWQISRGSIPSVRCRRGSPSVLSRCTGRDFKLA